MVKSRQVLSNYIHGTLHIPTTSGTLHCTSGLNSPGSAPSRVSIYTKHVKHADKCGYEKNEFIALSRYLMLEFQSRKKFNLYFI